MSTFTTSVTFKVSPSFIPYAVNALKCDFEAKGFDFEKKTGTASKTIIEVTKGNLVKQVVGLKQGLEITFEQDGSNVNVAAKGIVVKNQLVATSLTLLASWVFIIPQIIGLIKQSKLDKEAITIIENAHASFESESPTFCTHCGGKVTSGTIICPHCGRAL